MFERRGMPWEHFYNTLVKNRFFEATNKATTNEVTPSKATRSKATPGKVPNQVTNQANMAASQLTPGATGEPVSGAQASDWVAPITSNFQLDLQMPTAGPGRGISKGFA